MQIRAPPAIDISSNGDFDTYDSGGNGSEGSPWIIENYIINATGLSNGIKITDTTDYFILRNCTVISADLDGIYLSNVINGKLYNNTASSNGKSGIHLSSSLKNEIINNTANFNTNHGIQLSSSSNNNSIISNIAYDNEWNGIGLFASGRNNLTGNTANNNGRNGCYLFGAHYIRVIGNIFNYNEGNNYGCGIALENGDFCTITDNVANYNHEYGSLFLSASNNNTVTGNTFKGNYKGCWDESNNCEGNIFENNICNGDGISGFEWLYCLITLIVLVTYLAYQKPSSASAAVPKLNSVSLYYSTLFLSIL